MAELGAEALNGGVWNNGLGQIGIYVTRAGLSKLRTSFNLISFAPDTTRPLRLTVSDRSGALTAIEQALRRADAVSAEVVFDLPSVSYELGRNGQTTATGSGAFESEAMAQFSAVLAEYPAVARLNGEQNARAQLLTRSGALGRSLPVVGAVAVPMQLDRAAFYSLRERPGILAIRLAGFQDRRVTAIDPEAVALAKANGSVQVEIVLKGTEAFNASGGAMSKASWAKQKATNEAAIVDIIAAAGAELRGNHGDVGGAFATMSLDMLQRLATKADPRIASIKAVNAAAIPALTNSAATLMNMSPAWAAGYRGAGQYVAFLDTGIRKLHDSFKDAVGASRVVIEGCYGTTGTVASGANAGTWQTMCPSPNASGDSPAGLAGSGDTPPYSTCFDDCGHGTAMAGVAAGRSFAPNYVQGVAPDASIISINVYSKKVTANSWATITAFPQDIAAGLGYLYSITAATGVNPATLNMSLASVETYTGNCDPVNTTVSSYIQNLISRGVPVVAATGNNGSRNSISWPACVSATIKATAVHNDTTGTAIPTNVNLANPASFSGPMLIAPSGGNRPSGWSTWVRTSNAASQTPYDPPVYNGFISWVDTSASAAHITGYYAVVKAALPTSSVADITAWIMSTGSVNRQYVNGGATYNFRMPRAPF